MTTLLIEIGCEELPAAVCRSIYRQLIGEAAGDDKGGLLFRLLREERLLAPEEPTSAGVEPGGRAFADQLQVLISPRRIGVLVRDVPRQQLAQTQVFRGPRAAVAFGPDGAPTKAGLGFARARGVTAEELTREVIDGTEFAVARVAGEQLPTRDVLPRLVTALVAGLQVSRGMRWGARPAGETEYLRFSRPIRWLVGKLGRETIEFPFYGLRAGDVSQGHRVLGTPVVIENADDYQWDLREQKVIVDQVARRRQIERELDEQAAVLGGTWRDPGEVLDEAVYLVEWPSVQRGAFAEVHLRLPDEVLITAMQSHQRYFPVQGPEGALLPVFLYVSNADPAAAAIITHGNERVLEGRLDDAEFAYDRDLREGLPALADKLAAITFHEKLGSLADKTQRLEQIAAWLVTRAGGDFADLEEAVAVAARYAKADLPSQVVQEFPTLQGQMGGHYAAAAGLGDEVARAIADQYLPLSATAPLPGSLAGAVLAVADKADSIAAAWVTGERPSGSRDPYGLRRAAMGIVRIALEFSLRFPVRDLMAKALLAYAEQGVPATDEDAAGEMADFIWERLQALLLDAGLSFAFVESASGSLAGDLPAKAARAHSFAALAGRDFFDDVVTAFNRCAPLAAKAATSSASAVNPELFVEPVESELYALLASVRGPVLEQLDHLEIDSALVAAARLRPVIDRYFDMVLVMSPDEAIRANRLAQLAAITAVLRAIGDFGRLPVQAT
ncbi:MAG: glycine--tRNA ligase subunit beta [Thermoleophilia bacterium]